MAYDCDAIVLPGYTPPAPAPSYSYELACGEQRLQHTPRTRRPTPTSVFTKKSGRTTIILNEQEEHASIPSYGRQALITGTVCLEQIENVLEVKVQVEGKLDSTISEVGGRSIKVVTDRYTLWSHCRTADESCPSEVPFAFLLPATFKDGEESLPLPPSFHEHFIGVPTLFARASYQLHFTVTRLRHQKLGVWPKTKHVLIPFKYVPRTRAHRPILPSPCFFSSVKTSPEEWYQAVTYPKTRPSAKIDPVSCHLFVPAGRIYGITDKIPFHVQLAGKTCSLRELFSEPLLERVRSADSTNTIVPHTKTTPAKPLIRVYLLRQIAVTVKGSSAWRNKVIGEGTIWPMPPEHTSCCSSETSGCREDHVDWEGEVRCNDDITAGSFDVANVNVKDFIALSLSPPNKQTSPLLDLQISVPIRLVTESFTEEVDLSTH